MLPTERRVRGELRQTHGALFDLAADVLELALGVGAKSNGPLDDRGPGLERAVVATGLSLFAKTIKQSRSVQLLCRSGLGHDAIVVLRSQFEATLAVRFVLMPNFVPMRGAKPLLRPGEDLPRELRAHLYLTKSFERQEVALRSWLDSGDAGLAAEATAYLPHLKRELARSRAAIGPDWATRLKKQNYAGVSTEDLVKATIGSGSYATFYRFASGIAHASDAFSHMRVEDDSVVVFSPLPSEELVRRALWGSAASLTVCSEAVNCALSLGFDEAIGAMNERLKTAIAEASS